MRVFVRQHQGLAPTLDFGIQRARARWIARQDADDASHPRRLELQMQTLEENPEAILCYCDVELVGESVYFPSIERFPHTMGLLAMQLCYQCPIAHSSVIFDRGAYREVGGYSVSEQYAEDFGLWGRLIRYGDFVSLPREAGQVPVARRIDHHCGRGEITTRWPVASLSATAPSSSVSMSCAPSVLIAP